MKYNQCNKIDCKCQCYKCKNYRGYLILRGDDPKTKRCYADCKEKE